MKVNLIWWNNELTFIFKLSYFSQKYSNTDKKVIATDIFWTNQGNKKWLKVKQTTYCIIEGLFLKPIYRIKVDYSI